MDCDEQGGTTLPPWQVVTVQGEPYEVAGYKLTPVARVLTYAAGQGTLRARSMSGWAAGLVRVKPVAVVVEGDGRQRRIRLAGTATGAPGAMLAGGVAITLLLWVVRRLARCGRRKQDTH
ncbi:MAG: hypothetical protein JXA93_15085 [Anaerolineae bacterium]|nr:hypothetical protein [Anaerolineae bacterium]